MELIFSELGHPPRRAALRSTVSYATYIGLLQLAREVPARLDDEEAPGADLTAILERR